MSPLLPSWAKHAVGAAHVCSATVLGEHAAKDKPVPADQPFVSEASGAAPDPGRVVRPPGWGWGFGVRFIYRVLVNKVTFCEREISQFSPRPHHDQSSAYDVGTALQHCSCHTTYKDVVARIHGIGENAQTFTGERSKTFTGSNTNTGHRHNTFALISML